MLFNFFRTKPFLQTTPEQIAGKICKELSNLSYLAKDEILKIVVKQTLPEKHLKFRPKCKHKKISKNNSYENEMDRASKYIDKYKGY